MTIFVVSVDSSYAGSYNTMQDINMCHLLYYSHATGDVVKVVFYNTMEDITIWCIVCSRGRVPLLVTYQCVTEKNGKKIVRQLKKLEHAFELYMLQQQQSLTTFTY